MEEKSFGQYGSAKNPTALGPATRERVDARTRELAELAGRDSIEVLQRDYEQAKREITGESEPDRQAAVLDSIPQK